MPPRPQSAGPRTFKPVPGHDPRGPRGFTGGGGLGFNASMMSKYSMVRGASIGAAFDASADRFRDGFMLSRHEVRAENKVHSCIFIYFLNAV